MTSLPLRSEFVLFAACLSLPLIGLIGYGLYDRTRDEFAAAESLARRTAESSAERIAGHVEGLRAALNALARRPLVKAMDAARCDPRLADLVDLYPRAYSFSVINPQGVIICHSKPLPRDRVMRIVDEELLREMQAQPRFLIHKPVVSRTSGRWVVGAMHPVMGEDGTLVGSVAVATELAQWDPFPPTEGLPPGVLITVVTSDGTTIAQSDQSERSIGRRVWDERLMGRVLEAREGVMQAKGPYGTDRIYGFKQVAGVPWFVLAGVPEEGIFAPARARMAWTAALVALTVGAVALLSWGFIERLSKPMRTIAAALRARAESRGEAGVPVAGPREVAAVARELNSMIESGAQAQKALAKQAERLRIMHQIDTAIITAVKPEAIAAAVLQPLRELLGVPRAIVNLIDAKSGEVEWLAAAGRHRVRAGPGVRFPSRLIGDVEALRRGEPQRIETRALPPGPEVDALLASGVHFYMAVPMIAGGELIGALSFGGEQDSFPAEQITIAREVAIQLAIAIGQARLFEQLRESERRFSDLLGNVQLVSVMLDREARITYCNDYLLRLTGWRHEEVIGRSWLELFIPPETVGLKERLATLLTDQPEGRHGEAMILTRAGERRLIRWNNSVLRSAAGDVIGTASIGEDITERKRIEQEIRDLNASLEQRVAERTAQLAAVNKELESFTYSVSHDLRAPIRAIDGFGRILQEDYAERLDAEGRRLLDVVRANSKQMGQLIDDLLAFSKLGRQEPAKSSVDMAALVREVIAGLNGAALPRIETLGMPPAAADRALLKQVWLNLVDNAIKYSGKRQDARIEIGGRQEAGENLYWVRDNGVGFDMRYAAKLFGVFQRLHGANDFPGTGVGLAIVQRVVSRHGGRVWAEARPDEGACFYFTLPGAT